MARSRAQGQARPLHKPRGPQGSERTPRPTPSLPPPPVPRMGPPGGCRALARVLLALLLVQRAGKADPHPGSLPGVSAPRGSRRPGCPGKTPGGSWPPGLGRASAGEQAESGASPPPVGPHQSGQGQRQARALWGGAPSFCARGRRALPDTGLPRGERAAGSREPPPPPDATPAAQPSSAPLSICLSAVPHPKTPWPGLLGSSRSPDTYSQQGRRGLRDCLGDSRPHLSPLGQPLQAAPQGPPELGVWAGGRGW